MNEDRWLANIENRLELMEVDDVTKFTFASMWDDADDEERVRLRSLSDQRLLAAIHAAEQSPLPDIGDDETELREAAGTGTRMIPVEVPVGQTGRLEAGRGREAPTLTIEGGDGADLIPPFGENQDVAEQAREIVDLSITRVLAWVGDDSVRARYALLAENAHGDEKRPSLVRRLEKLADF